ncbi:ras guanine nucleotide exchange factor domain-containing protein [Glomus cerebriforme]|uniref:Ras guanine nucleotide exchange factor domain-containing protein n=1 Tax=Glomus cerebriforme TaxID=658196 RepID=A0A397S738_9GLOM|nr:ras guanine nucleotide exchange factor domain-containing protein [Glomus cerebriforme]
MTTSVLVVRALYDFNSNDTSSLSFKRDDIIQVLTQLESGWWDGLCNGERGWFPSNYVTTYEEGELLDDEEDKLSGWISQQTPDGETFYYNTRTQESAWDLPDDNESITTNIRDTISSNRSLRQLPENWIQQPTEDGNTYYYYNVITKEIRWTYPGGGTTTLVSDIDEDKDDERIDSHVTSALVEVNQHDLENVETADKASIASSQSSQLSSTTIDTIRQRSQQRNSIENLPSNWGQKTTPQGRIYYYNKLTDETTWSLDSINADGHLLRDEPNESGSGDEVPREPLSPASIDQPRESSILMFQNSEQLTWDSLSQSVVLAIQHLNLAATDNIKQNYANCTNDIVESIRIMLYASGTIEKDSPAIKQDKNLKNCHRHIMASLSKLVLSTKVASGVWPPPDAAQKMRSDADEVLMAVRQFVQAAEHTVGIKRVDPKILESATGGSWRGNNLSSIQTNGINGTNGRITKPSSISSSVNSQDNNSAPNSPTILRSLTPDLIASLDQISRTVNQTILLLVSNVKKIIDTPHSSISNVNISFSLISQTKQVITQVGQFLSFIEDINLEELDESSLDTINEFNIAKQALYDNIAKLVICAQSATDPLAPLNAMDQVLVSTDMMDKAIKDVVIATKFLAEEKGEQEQMKLRPRRPSTVEVPPTKRRITSNYSTNSSTSNSNTLDQIIENDSNDSTENQPNTTPPVPSSGAGLQTVPENDIISTNGSTLIGDDVQTSPVSVSGGRRIRSDSTVSSKTYNDTASSHSHPPLQRSQTQPVLPSSASADYPFSSSPPPTNGNTGGTKSPRSENKVNKFFGEENIPSNLTQSHGKKEDRPWFLNYDYDPSEMIFNMESYVKGGTLNALVERLTMHDLLDSNFIATFLLTYRSFCTTDEFFDMLVKRFMIQPPEGIANEELEVWQEKKQTPVRLRVFNIMKTWLETYYLDGRDSHCLERMREFATTTMHENMAFAAVSLIKVIEKRQQQPKDAKFRELVLTNSDRPPAPILPKNIKKLKFLDIDPLEIGRQLTLIECKLYNKIQPVECLDKAWSKEEGGDIAANIKAMIVNSNQITGWVAESVLNQSEVKKRCLYIKHFVAVADKCRSLNNFNSLTAIISGLNSAPIHRLKRTWEMVNTKTIQTLETLNKIMNSTKNFAEYREMLHSVNPPCVPFLGVYLTDLTFIEDGNPNNLKKSRQLINFSKRMKTAEVIREIQQYQSVPYNLSPVQEIQMFIQCHLQESRDVGDLYDQSLSMEPREREDEKIARLLQESGFL